MPLSLFMPKEKCLIGNICMIKVKSNNNNHLNVTVDYFYFDEKPSQTCHLGGLLAVEVLANNYVESDTLCRTSNYTFYQKGRSFYSYNSSLILFMYWYKYPGVIKATLKISTTKCKTVKICPQYHQPTRDKGTNKFTILFKQAYHNNSNKYLDTSQHGNLLLLNTKGNSCAFLTIAKCNAGHYENGNYFTGSYIFFNLDLEFGLQEICEPGTKVAFRIRSLLNPLDMNVLLKNETLPACRRCTDSSFLMRYIYLFEVISPESQIYPPSPIKDVLSYYFYEELTSPFMRNTVLIRARIPWEIDSWIETVISQSDTNTTNTSIEYIPMTFYQHGGRENKVSTLIEAHKYFSVSQALQMTHMYFS